MAEPLGYLFNGRTGREREGGACVPEPMEANGQTEPTLIVLKRSEICVGLNALPAERMARAAAISPR